MKNIVLSNSFRVVVLFSFLIMSNANIGFAQKCKYFKEGKDEFSGETFKETRDQLAMGIYFHLGKKGATNYATMHFMVPAATNYVVQTTDTLFLKLESGPVVKLTPVKSVSGGTQASAYGVATGYSPDYGITTEQLQLLTSSPIMKVRISFEKTVDFSPKKGEAKDIMNAARCVLL